MSGPGSLDRPEWAHTARRVIRSGPDRPKLRDDRRWIELRDQFGFSAADNGCSRGTIAIKPHQLSQMPQTCPQDSRRSRQLRPGLRQTCGSRKRDRRSFVRLANQNPTWCDTGMARAIHISGGRCIDIFIFEGNENVVNFLGGSDCSFLFCGPGIGMLTEFRQAVRSKSVVRSSHASYINGMTAGELHGCHHFRVDWKTTWPLLVTMSAWQIDIAALLGNDLDRSPTLASVPKRLFACLISSKLQIPIEGPSAYTRRRPCQRCQYGSYGVGGQTPLREDDEIREIEFDNVGQQCEPTCPRRFRRQPGNTQL